MSVHSHIIPTPAIQVLGYISYVNTAAKLIFLLLSYI